MENEKKNEKENKIELTADQEEAMKLLKSGRNVFVTGEAGTGKSTLINEYRKYLEENKIEHIVCAPTGIAAINVGGATLHRTFGAPIGFISEDECNKRKKEDDVIKNAKVIIIDEISMCRWDLFDYVTSYINQMCRGEGWCNGKQIVVVGDFLQLPPVISGKEKQFFAGTGGFAFEGRTWKKCRFRTVYLHRIVRQSDETFIHALNQARIGDPNCISYFNMRVSPYDEDAVTLCAKNITADEINNRRLYEQPGEEKCYTASFKGDAKKGDFNGTESLRLKVGARVMAIANDVKEERYANGSMGTVTDLGDESVEVEWDNGLVSQVGVNKWDKNKYEVSEKTVTEEVYNKKTGEVEEKKRKKKVISTEVTGEIRQIPLRLGYAITIHKSQGNTFDALNVDLSEVFQEGQAYVAISRCASPSGLHLKKPVWPAVFMPVEDVNAFYNECEREEHRIRQAEAEAEAIREAAQNGVKAECAIAVDRKTADMISAGAQTAGMNVQDYLRNLVQGHSGN